jgi:carbamoyl-phosphate synthase large subunit
MEIKRPGYGLHPGDRWLAARQREHDPVADDSVWFDAFGRETLRAAPAFGGTSLGEAPADVREESTRAWPVPDDVLVSKIATPCQGRIYYIRYAFKLGWTVERVHELSGIDPWFLDQLAELAAFEDELLGAAAPRGPDARLTPAAAELYQRARMLGYSDAQLRYAWQLDAATFERIKRQLDRPKFKLVDTCAAEFEAFTPYYYATRERPLARVIEDAAAVAELRQNRRAGSAGTALETIRRLGVAAPHRFQVLDDEHLLVESHDDELRVSERPKVIILGGGPNRIGQGIEFDYCCVHAAMAARAAGFETVMINSNPETVSTDYNVSDLLFFEPLTHEDVLNICERLNGRPFARHGANDGYVRGVIVQYGGQTPLNLAEGLADAGAPILGTSPQHIHQAEDRERFQQILRELGLRQPPNRIAHSQDEAVAVAEELGYPVLARPSYVLGGRGMQVCNNVTDLMRYIHGALDASDRSLNIDQRHPILIEKFLLDAVEVDVDAISDYGFPGRDPAEGRCDICGIMEHIEEAGIHSGDSCCALPPYSLSPALIDEIKYQVKLLARQLHVCGLMNVQFAVQGRVVYLIEVNPRASRTVPFVSKATGVPWVKLATRVMLGTPLDESLREIGAGDLRAANHTAVKVPVFPFRKLRTIDFVLGPEMRSTGEVMGIDASYPLAFAKGLRAAGLRLPTGGRVLVSVCDDDKPRVISIARELHELGFEIFSTIKTRRILAEHGVPATLVSKHDGQGPPFLLDMIRNGQLDLLINTPIHTGSATDEGRWRVASIQRGIPLITTLAGARATVGAIRALRDNGIAAHALQDYLQAGDRR